MWSTFMLQSTRYFWQDESSFQPNLYISQFAVLYEARANTGINRMKIIDTVAKLVPSPHKVDLSNPEINIVVQIVKVHIIAYKSSLLFFAFLCHTNNSGSECTRLVRIFTTSLFSFVDMQSIMQKILYQSAKSNRGRNCQRVSILLGISPKRVQFHYV